MLNSYPEILDTLLDHQWFTSLLSLIKSLCMSHGCCVVVATISFAVCTRVCCSSPLRPLVPHNTQRQKSAIITVPTVWLSFMRTNTSTSNDIQRHVKLSFRHHLKSLSGVMQPEIALEFMHADSQRFTNQQFPALPEKRQRPRECHPQGSL